MNIFMELMDGSLKHLIDGIEVKIVHQFFSSMLRAIDFLRSKSLIHRDVKPENILFKRMPDGLEFRLADFGLCNHTNLAVSLVGTGHYMAPEVYFRKDQGPPVDVWSLFATLVDVLDVEKFRTSRPRTMDQVYNVLQNAAESNQLVGIKDMAILDPQSRASAGEILRRVYEEEPINDSTALHLKETVRSEKDVLRKTRRKTELQKHTGKAKITKYNVIERARRELIAADELAAETPF